MVECRVVKVSVDIEPVEMGPHRTGSASAQGLTNCTGSGTMVVVGAETWW